MYRRPHYAMLRKRLLQPRRFLQVLAGPRQCGKTTLVHQVMDGLTMPCHYATADEPALKDRLWIEQQWEVMRAKMTRAGKRRKGVLVLDEIQKIRGWSETVKRLWDEDARGHVPLQVLLLGSAPLLVQQGLTESLAGRFEVTAIGHWSFPEMRDAFGWSLDKYIYYGGYPGSAPLVREPERWRRYILDALIETTIGRDILLMQRIDKPALLRRMFELGCSHSGQILSYQKMIGQLQDAGNTTTLAHYLDLLRGCGLLGGLSKFAGQRVRRRASSPKLQVHNTALLAAQSGLGLKEVRQQPEHWGRFVESAVGASLINGIEGTSIRLHYWSARNREVDFVLVRGPAITAIEVKSGRRRGSLPGLEAFCKEFQVGRKLLVGRSGIGLEDFLAAPIEAWI
jgi:predicted AAA+ superfamily ATPase